MGRPLKDAEVRDLLAFCEAADDQDTGSLDAFRAAATVGVVAELCRSVLAQGRVIEAARRVIEETKRDADGLLTANETFCLKPRWGTGMCVRNYPWYLRPADPVRCLCGAAECADASANPDPYWLAGGVMSTTDQGETS